MPLSLIKTNSIAAGNITSALITSVANTAIVGRIATAQQPTGTVLQTVTANKTDTFSTTNWTMVDVTGLSVTLTPRDANSRFLILYKVVASNNYYATYINLVRNGTAIALPDAAGSRARVTSQYALDQTQSNAHGFVHHHNLSYVDTPATTSSITYKIQVSGRDGGYVTYINKAVPDRDTTEYDVRHTSFITVLEIAG